MITEKDIQTRVDEMLAKSGFNVVAGEVDEGFDKPAVFVTVYPVNVKLLSCGGRVEQVTYSVEIQYISAKETIEDCIEVSNLIKEIFLYHTFDIQDRHITIQEIEFEIEKKVLYAYFEISFIQGVNTDTDYEKMENIQIGGLI